mmetsp:Transcript_16841/g.48789  ORF Transcript_16841/g.48789 Transcript_16841/m.48789 type:complete len:112 (+) Transcript_16841:59-394(+)
MQPSGDDIPRTPEAPIHYADYSSTAIPQCGNDVAALHEHFMRMDVDKRRRDALRATETVVHLRADRSCAPRSAAFDFSALLAHGPREPTLHRSLYARFDHIMNAASSGQTV